MANKEDCSLETIVRVFIYNFIDQEGSCIIWRSFQPTPTAGLRLQLEYLLIILLAGKAVVLFGVHFSRHPLQDIIVLLQYIAIKNIFIVKFFQNDFGGQTRVSESRGSGSWVYKSKKHDLQVDIQSRMCQSDELGITPALLGGGGQKQENYRIYQFTRNYFPFWGHTLKSGS